MRILSKILFIVLITAMIVSCGDQELTTMEQLAKDIGIIDQYIADNGIVAQTDPSGVRYTVVTEGTGPKPLASSIVVVNYTGKFLDGTVFDGPATNQSFQLSQLISGWQIAFPLIPEGSTVVLYIPSGLGYGKKGGGPVPPNTNLIFEVDLIEVR